MTPEEIEGTIVIGRYMGENMDGINNWGISYNYHCSLDAIKEAFIKVANELKHFDIETEGYAHFKSIYRAPFNIEETFPALVSAIKLLNNKTKEHDN